MATVAARSSSSSTDAPRSSGSAGQFIAVQPGLAPKRCKSCWPTRGRDCCKATTSVWRACILAGWKRRCRSLRCRHFARSPARCCVRSTTAPIPRWGWSRPGPFSKPGHFWHDRAQRPTAFGWQRAEDPAKVAHVLKQVPAMTGTPNEWVVWVRHRIDCRLHRAPENGERLSISCGRPPRWRGRVRRTRPSFPCGCWPLRVEPHGCVLPPAWRGGSRHRVDGGGIVQLYSWKMRVIVAV